MLFAGISGTAVSDIASLGRTLIKLMTRAGYPLTYSAALTSATSIIGPIIPPSVAMIIYALAVGNISVGAMFAAGAIPGVLFGAGFFVMAWFKTRQGHYGVVLPRPDLRSFLRQTLRVLPLLVLPVIIVGGIFSGVFTVTESAAAGTAYTILVGVLRKPRLRWRDLYDATLYSAVISAVAGMLLGAGAIVAWILTFNRVTQSLADMLLAMAVGPEVFMLMVVAVLLVLGMLMDAVPIMIALAPLLAPIARQYGISDVQFGLVFVVTCMIGLVTPPVGIILFMTSSIANVRLEPLSLAVLPFVIWMIAVVILIVFVPSLTLWLPKVVGF
jgi:tripartite ATP-independent transporter DctM subunit